MGDLNNGSYAVGATFTGIPIDDPTTPVNFTYQIVNSGNHDDNLDARLGNAAEILAGAAVGTAVAGFPHISVWPLIAAGAIEGVNLAWSFLDANCDGTVAADSIQGTRSDFDNLIATTGTYSETRSYPGTDSNAGCGSNSQYSATWSVSQSPVGMQSSPLSVDQPPHYAGVWRPGTGAQWVQVNLTKADFFALTQHEFNQGLFLTDMTTYTQNGQQLWAGIWHGGSGAQWVAADLSEANFHALDQQKFNQGLRLTRMITYTVNGQQLWAGIWQRGSGAQWVTTGLSLSAFSTLLQQRFNQGLFLTDIASYIQNGQQLWGGVWHTGSGALWVKVDLSEGDFQTLDQQEFNQGMILIRMITYMVNGQQRWGGIWQGGGSGALWVQSSLPLYDFANAVQTKFNQRLFLTNIAVY